MADDRLPLLTFADAASLNRWLDEHGATSPGVWLRFAKKGATEDTISKSDAIDCALACGVVDGQLGRVDDWSSRPASPRGGPEASGRM